MKNRKSFFVIIGIVAIVLGVVCFILDVGSYESNIAYGGDAYTGIQNAAAQTANNVMCLAIIAKFGFGSILVVAGLSLIAFASAIKTTDANESATPFTPSYINTPEPENNL